MEPDAPPRRRPRAQITDRDRAVLELLAEHRVAVVSQVQALLGVSSPAAEARLRVLADHGYVRHERIFAGHPATVWITRKGLNSIESPLPAPRVDLKGYRHDIGVGWLWLAAREGAFGALRAQHSEREMRSSDRRADTRAPWFGVGLRGSAGAGGVHYPDLMLETAGGRRVAVELELTAKSARRLDRIMLAYAGDRRVDAVLYLCPRGQIGQRVHDAARRAGVSDLVRVQWLAAGSPPGAPDPAGVRHRGVGRGRRTAAQPRSRRPAEVER